MNPLVTKFINNVVEYKNINYRKHAIKVADSIIEEYSEYNVPRIINNYADAITQKMWQMFDSITIDGMYDDIKTRTDVNYLYPNQIASNIERSLKSFVADKMIPEIHDNLICFASDRCSEVLYEFIESYISDELSLDVLRDNIPLPETVITRCQRAHVKPDEIKKSILDAISRFN